MASVSVVHLRMRFGAVTALDDVTLHVADGESIAILGPSGCGKTTLLRLIAGLETPDAGSILFDGEDVSTLGAGERGIGMVFQSYALYPHMDSKRNLGFFFKMHRREPEVDDRVDAVCEVMGPGFRDLLNRRPKQLSGGQQQRVAIGRCIIRHPRVFLFDEPLSNLDAKLRAQTRVEIKRLLRRFSVTSFYVTHDQTEAIAIGDRLAIVRAGALEQVGTYRQLYDAPANTFVAGFLGSPPMNLYEGVVSQGAFHVMPAPHERREGSGEAGSVATLPLPEKFARAFKEDERLTVGIRPESFHLALPDEPALEARVVVSEPLFAERQQLVTCTLGADPLRSPEIVAKIGATERLWRGETLRLAYDPDGISFFERNGVRVSAVV